jgi:CubicO group peptidase (beta-lactamase class C family)
MIESTSRGIAPEYAEKLLKMLGALSARPSNPHAVLALQSADGSLAWSGAAGAANAGGVPMTMDTPYFIASIDKLYIATATLRLVERGSVRLDEPIATYLPESLWRAIHVLDGTDHSASITVAHLLSHTTGLADYLEDRPKGGRSLIEILVEDGDRSWGAEVPMARVRDELVPHFAPQSPSAAKPRVRYCDTNFQLLIALIESVSGRRLADVFADDIFRPLGMRHTYFPGVTEPDEKPAAPPADLWFGDKVLDLPRALVSLRSVNSTAADQMASLKGILDGSVFERPETAALMRRQWNRFGFPVDAAALRAPGWPIEYGLGMMRFKLPRWATPAAAVPAVIGHTGSTGSWLFHCPELDVYLAGTVDQATAGAVPYRFVPQVLTVLGRAMAR